MLGSDSPSKSRYYATFARRTTGRLRKRHAFHAIQANTALLDQPLRLGVVRVAAPLPGLSERLLHFHVVRLCRLGILRLGERRPDKRLLEESNLKLPIKEPR